MNRDALDRLERIRKAQLQRDLPYRKVWKQVSDWIDPTYGRMEIDSPPQAGTPENKIYDYTIGSYSNIFAMGLQGYCCSSQSAFFELLPENREISDEDAKVKKTLQKRSRTIYRALRQSNFYSCNYSFLKSFGDLSTGIMFFNVTPEGKISFESVPIYQCIPIWNKVEGKVDTIFRVHWLTRFEAEQLWGYDNLPSCMKGDNVDESKLWKFWELLCPRDRFSFDLGVQNGWKYLDIVYAEADPTTTVFEGGSDRQRFTVCTFNKIDDGTGWGVGAPGTRQFITSHDIQNMTRDQRNSSRYMANPAVMKTENLPVKIARASLIDMPAGASIAPLQLGQDLSWTNVSIQTAKMQAKSDYFVDYFLMLSQYSGNINTATLAQGLQNEQVMMMTSFLDSLANGFFEPVIEWMWNTLGSLGYFNDGENISWRDLQVDYVSALYKLQKQAFSLDPTNKALSALLPMLQLDQSLISYIDFGNLVEVVADSTSADRRIIRDKEEAKKLIEAQAQQQAMEMQRQQDIQQQDADTRRYVAESSAPEQGSPAAEAQNKYKSLRLK